eukprot:2602686-Rhodomonas_salina.3
MVASASSKRFSWMRHTILHWIASASSSSLARTAVGQEKTGQFSPITAQALAQPDSSTEAPLRGCPRLRWFAAAQRAIQLSPSLPLLSSHAAASNAHSACKVLKSLRPRWREKEGNKGGKEGLREGLRGGLHEVCIAFLAILVSIRYPPTLTSGSIILLSRVPICVQVPEVHSNVFGSKGYNPLRCGTKLTKRCISGRVSALCFSTGGQATFPKHAQREAPYLHLAAPDRSLAVFFLACNSISSAGHGSSSRQRKDFEPSACSSEVRRTGSQT